MGLTSVPFGAVTVTGRLKPSLKGMSGLVSADLMAASVAEHANAEQADAWREVTRQRRVLSFGLLADTLASR